MELDLLKPATVLIESIRDAIGWAVEPTQIRRIAEAQADAKRIEATADIDIEEMRSVRLNRMLKEAELKQSNSENITLKAIPYLQDDADASAVDPDFFHAFFEQAKLISNSQMQELWAKFLAGEANNPGFFSRRALSFLPTLERKDAEMFTSFCSFCVTVDRPIFSYFRLDSFFTEKLPMHDVSHLVDIGLVREGRVAAKMVQRPDQTYSMIYFGQRFTVVTEKPPVFSEFGFTDVGRQLAPISGAKPIPGFVEATTRKWQADT